MRCPVKCAGHWSVPMWLRKVADPGLRYCMVSPENPSCSAMGPEANKDGHEVPKVPASGHTVLHSALFTPSLLLLQQHSMPSPDTGLLGRHKLAARIYLLLIDLYRVAAGACLWRRMASVKRMWVNG